MQQGVVRGASGEYRIYAEIGVGGMATVHLARFLGRAGFARTVAIKRPLPALQKSADFRRLATTEALLAARVQHPHVVATLDVIDSASEFLIVMQYVHGEPLSVLTALAHERGERVPLEIAVTLVGGVLRGLAAVHRARDERGRVLGLIHRDVSPQNVLCGVDGVARLADFGLAKAAGYTAPSNASEFKGKLTYASPEQVELQPLTHATDIYAVGVVLWELSSGTRMHQGRTPSELVAQVLRGDVPPPSRFAPSLPPPLDGVVLRALARAPEQRYESALAMAAALEACVRPASVEATAEWIADLASESLRARALLVIDAESETAPSQREPTPSPVGPLEPTVLAEESPELRANPRDRGLLGPSTRTSSLRNATLKLFAMAAGVSLVWFAGERWRPRPAPPAPLDARAGDPAEIPARGSAAARLDGGGAPTSASRPLSGPRIDATKAALRAEPRRVADRPLRSGPPIQPPPDCSPPFSLDAEGIRHMKPGCK